MQIARLTWALLALTGLAGAAPARARIIEDQHGSLKTLTSIGDALDAPDHHPVHILYVHGIDQLGAGGSAMLRESICTKLRLCAVSDWKNAGVEFADKGEFADGAPPPALAYLDNPVWKNAEEWHAAAPFVVHWVAHLRSHATVLILDEINWWPLVLALKCQRIVTAEAYLAGPDRELLRVCSEQAKQDPDNLGRFYPWIPPDKAKKLAAMPARGVLVNRTLKDGLIDWGVSDVMITVGPLGGIIRDGMRQLMAESAAFDPHLGPSPDAAAARERYNWRAQLQRSGTQTATLDQEFIGVTHSLGSYLLFNTLTVDNANATPQASPADAQRRAAEDSAMQYIFGRMSLCYLFANQLELLEITNLEATPANAPDAYKSRGLEPPPAPTGPAANFRDLVACWEQFQSDFQAELHPNDAAAREKVQVVAWSDPSDVITWRVPRIGDVDVVNLYVQNSTRWLWLLESPNAAHCDYAENKAVLRVMFGDTQRRPAD